VANPNSRWRGESDLRTIPATFRQPAAQPAQIDLMDEHAHGRNAGPHAGPGRRFAARDAPNCKGSFLVARRTTIALGQCDHGKKWLTAAFSPVVIKIKPLADRAAEVVENVKSPSFRKLQDDYPDA
jgi:hypothetical protein